MARVLTTLDAYAIVNAMVKEQTGQNASITALDPSSFVSVGEQLLSAGTEATLNALSMVLGRTFVAVRPYNAKFATINAVNSGVYANRLRKISFYSREAVEDGSENTQLNAENLILGQDNGAHGTSPNSSTPSMWEQNPPIPLEIIFSGSSEVQTVTTVYEKQLQVAFRSPEDFIDFVEGIMVEKGNDIESMKEAFNRMTVLNAIAGAVDMSNPESVINMVTAFNNAFGTSYTRADLLGVHFTEFVEFFVSTVKTISDRMTNRSAKYHWSPTYTDAQGNTHELLRHTPKAKQKMLVYNPFWISAEARVKPAIFNERYIDFGNFEGVDFWQNEYDSSEIDIVPAIPDVLNPTQQTAGARVQIEYCLAFIFDEDACMVDYQLDDATTTPLEARKHYRNLWWTIRRNAINDFTENMVVLHMG